MNTCLHVCACILLGTVLPLKAVQATKLQSPEASRGVVARLCLPTTIAVAQELLLQNLRSIMAIMKILSARFFPKEFSQKLGQIEIQDYRK